MFVFGSHKAAAKMSLWRAQKVRESRHRQTADSGGRKADRIRWVLRAGAQQILAASVNSLNLDAGCLRTMISFSMSSTGSFASRRRQDRRRDIGMRLPSNTAAQSPDSFSYGHWPLLIPVNNDISGKAELVRACDFSTTLITRSWAVRKHTQAT